MQSMSKLRCSPVRIHLRISFQDIFRNILFRCAHIHRLFFNIAVRLLLAHAQVFHKDTLCTRHNAHFCTVNMPNGSILSFT